MIINILLGLIIINFCLCVWCVKKIVRLAYYVDEHADKISILKEYVDIHSDMIDAHSRNISDHMALMLTLGETPEKMPGRP